MALPVALVESVNAGGLLPLAVRGRTVNTGIRKAPQGGAVGVDLRGLSGDNRAEVRKFGEEFHAVHAYPAEHLSRWAERYPETAFVPGLLGENLTVRGATEERVCIGDVVACGTARMEICQPRIPCRRVSARVGIPEFSRVFLESLRVGYYLRVLRPGRITAGDTFEVIERPAEAPTVRDFLRIAQFDYWDAEGLARLLRASGLPPLWREMLEEKRARAEAAILRGGWFGSRRLRLAARQEPSPGRVLLSLECPQGGTFPGALGGLLLVLPEGPRQGARLRCSLAESPGVSSRLLAQVEPDQDGAEALRMLPVGQELLGLAVL